MNHLTHLYFADPTPECRLGALMGDFVKGRLEDRYSPELRWGLRQHRLLDRFAESNLYFRQSKLRLCPTFRHCRGLLVDVIYDHFLARNWTHFFPTPLDRFVADVYHLMEKRQDLLPPALQQAVPRMVAADFLVVCREIGSLEGVLHRLAARLSRPVPLEKGLGELLRNYRELENDFEGFMIDAAAFMAELRREKRSR